MTDIISDGDFANLEKVCPIPDTAAGAPRPKGRTILRAVAAKHNLQIADILGRDRFDNFFDARREAIILMKDSGLMPVVIARIVNRDRTTVLYYLSSEMRARKLAFNRRWRQARRRAAELSA